MRFTLSGSAITLIFVAGPVSAFVATLLDWMESQRVVLMLSTCVAATLLTVALTRRPHLTQAARTASWALAAFVLSMALANGIAQIQGVRNDPTDMWLQAIMALAPAGVVLAAQRWAATRLNVTDLDRGAVALAGFCIASITLEITGILAVETSAGTRYFGFLGDMAAWYLSFCAVYFVARTKLLLALVVVFCLILTQSRGALVAFVAFVLGVAVIFMARVPLPRKILGDVGLVLIAALVATTFLNYLDRVQGRFGAVDLFSNDRTRTIAFTLLVFSPRPIFGSGYNSHTYSFKQAGIYPPSGEVYWATPTSFPVQVLADAGLVGFTAFVIYVGAVVWMCIRALRAEHASRSRRDARIRAALTGLAAWLMPSLVLNHSAAWLLPGSGLSLLVLVAAGVVSRAMIRVEEEAPAPAGAAARPAE